MNLSNVKKGLLRIYISSEKIAISFDRSSFICFYLLEQFCCLSLVSTFLGWPFLILILFQKRRNKIDFLIQDNELLYSLTNHAAPYGTISSKVRSMEGPKRLQHINFVVFSLYFFVVQFQPYTLKENGSVN